MAPSGAPPSERPPCGVPPPVAGSGAPPEPSPPIGSRPRPAPPASSPPPGSLSSPQPTTRTGKTTRAVPSGYFNQRFPTTIRSLGEIAQEVAPARARPATCTPGEATEALRSAFPHDERPISANLPHAQVRQPGDLGRSGSTIHAL